MGRGTPPVRRRVRWPLPADLWPGLIPSAIRVETERLILRAFRATDFEEYAAITGEPDTFRYSGRGPMGPKETWARLLRQTGHWALLGYGLFAVEEKASGRLVGETGLGDFRRGLGAAFDSFPEAAWTIAGWAQGRGYASEAAAAAHHWIEHRLGAGRTVCLIHVENGPSLRVADKLGYTAFAERTYRGYRALLHARPRRCILPLRSGEPLD